MKKPPFFEILAKTPSKPLPINGEVWYTVINTVALLRSAVFFHGSYYEEGMVFR